LLGILKKGGIVYGPHNRNPRIFSTISDGRIHPAIAGAEKRTTRLLRILKKDRIDFWEFRKKAGSVAEYFQKRLDRSLRIPEKGWLSS
jgi:hypothetical protein